MPPLPSYLYREQRTLGTLLAIALDQPNDQVRLTLANLYNVVLAGTLTVFDACRAVAAALDAAAPIQAGTLQGWLQPRAWDGGWSTRSAPTSLTDLLVLHPWTREPAEQLTAFSLQPTTPFTGDIDELDRLVRQWLTLLWLDLGFSDFEHDIEALVIPTWMPQPG